MKLSERWLKEWAELTLEHDTLVTQLAMAGHEVAASEPVSLPFTQVVVGEIQGIAPHPEADRLQVCTVNIGADHPLSIVCGASNVAVGIKVPVATVGATLGSAITIKDTVLRGVPSAGMICSREELGLGESLEKGILHLPDNAPIGEKVFDYLHCDDVTLQVDLTPNRGDCLSVAGIARELGVLNQKAYRPFKHHTVAVTQEVQRNVYLDAPERCPRYVGRTICHINPQATTPHWMSEQLRRCGLRPLNPVVDVTNYVLIALGQPLHAFDNDSLQGDIHVRLSKAGETLTLLDEQTIECQENTLLIADDEKPIALAGIMGGSGSAVTEKTQHVFLESAFFAPIPMSGCARRYGLHTEASHRYERGVDPSMQIHAIEYATQLIIDIMGGEPGPLTEIINTDHMPKMPVITLRKDRVAKVLGIVLEEEKVQRILEQLGMSVVAHDAHWQVSVPPHRFDLQEEVDLIEELARIYGYDAIPAKALQVTLAMAPQKEVQVTPHQCKQILMARDYQEVITYSFVEPGLQQQLDPQQTPKVLTNPLSQDMSVMRTNLWPGLVNALRYNLRRQQSRARFFEVGLRFINHPEKGLQQEKVVAGLIYGTATAEQWNTEAVPVDFYHTKGDVEALLRVTGMEQRYDWVPSSHEALHPNQSADILRDGQIIGHVGGLHPKIAQKLNVSSQILVFELLFSGLNPAALPKFATLSKYPAIRRDIAVVLPTSVTLKEVKQAISAVSGPQLKDVHLFDIYEGQGIDEGKRSLALGLLFQDPTCTLADETVNPLVDTIVAQLKQQYGAILRT
ncbi:MAG: phenylalanine--tRNA ligase subunit beta [Gammaproteobacteria bacterium]